jgi:PEP-CTERM motif
MKLQLLNCLAVAYFTIGVYAPARADVINVGGIDAARSFRAFSSVDYENIRARLLNPANFGAGGVVPDTVAFAPDLSVANAASLAGLDVLVMSEVFKQPGSPLFAGEAEAIRDFVLGGGCLCMITDTLHATNPPGGNGTSPTNAILSLFGAGAVGASDLTGLQSSLAGAITGSGGIVTSGLFGTLTAGSNFGATWHNPLTAVGPTVAFASRNGTPVAMGIEPGALGVGSGGVLVTGDILFADFFIPPDGTDALENEANAIMFLNFLSGCKPVPEPSSLFLSAIGLGGLAVARRRFIAR